MTSIWSPTSPNGTKLYLSTGEVCATPPIIDRDTRSSVGPNTKEMAERRKKGDGYWLAHRHNEDGKVCYRHYPTRKAAVHIIWAAAAHLASRKDDLDSAEGKALRKRVYTEGRYFTWTWRAHGIAICYYLLDCSPDYVEDTVDLEDHFPGWE